MKLGALSKRLPAKGGRTLRMARYDRLPTAPVPLGPSGATPPATPLNRVDIDATMSFYGLYIAINQQVTLGLRGYKTDDNYWENLKTFVHGNPRQVSFMDAQPQRLNSLALNIKRCYSLNLFERLGAGINKTCRQINFGH